jgi:heavy metal sensor kinase
MAEAAEGITQERLADRLPVENPADEFGRLATVVNAMLARIEDAFERLRRFTSDASHELRTPLTAIRIVGEASLVETRDAAGYRQTISSILEETDRLTAMIEDLLVLAREDSKTYRSRFEAVDLGKLASDVADVLRPVSEESGQALACEAEPEVLVRGDRTILRQAIVNLVDNAIRYTPRGGSIELRVHAEDGAAEVSVADSGPGIAPEHREKVFERFYRIETDRSRVTGGAGLGLPIARWAVDLHGGRLDLESEIGRGSTFRIRMPRMA